MKAEATPELAPESISFARFFAALGDATRQQILLLCARNDEMCVNEIARLFKLSRPAISHHLKVLREAGLVCSEKRGKEVYYRPDFTYCSEMLDSMRSFVERHLAATITPDAPVVQRADLPASPS